MRFLDIALTLHWLGSSYPFSTLTSGPVSGVNYTGEHAEIAVDRLPFIGSFIEVEGDDSLAIGAVLRSLQLSSKDAVRENYTELLEAMFKEIGLPLRPSLQATFEAEARWRGQT
jgi:hypothetical protein